MLSYIDAGTGSALAAMLAGGAAGLWMYVKTTFRTRLRGRSKQREETEVESDSPSSH